VLGDLHLEYRQDSRDCLCFLFFHEARCDRGL
jgi:hypothetical protein